MEVLACCIAKIFVYSGGKRDEVKAGPRTGGTSRSRTLQEKRNFRSGIWYVDLDEAKFEGDSSKHIVAVEDFFLGACQVFFLPIATCDSEPFILLDFVAS
jgi:hypothetical protein